MQSLKMEKRRKSESDSKGTKCTPTKPSLPREIYPLSRNRGGERIEETKGKEKRHSLHSTQQTN